MSDLGDTKVNNKTNMYNTPTVAKENSVQHNGNLQKGAWKMNYKMHKNQQLTDAKRMQCFGTDEVGCT
jgi:hypothetical protein